MYACRPRTRSKLRPATNNSSGKTRKGSTWLHQVLIEAGHAAAKTKNTYLSTLFHRLVGRRGKKRAAVAVGHAILVIAYHLITRNEAYQDLGASYFDERERRKVVQRLVHRLERLGLSGPQLNPTPVPV